MHLHAHVGLETADHLGSGIPGVGMRPPNLRLSQILIVREDMRHGR